MNYNEWLELLNRLKTSSKISDIKMFLNEPINNNLKDMIKPKVKDMLEERFKISIERITNNIDSLFEDQYILDMELVNFRKDSQITLDLLNNGYLDEDEKRQLKQNYEDGIDEVFTIIEKEALRCDDTGILSRIVNNNRIKRDDKNEL